jgi:hypothetical protein
LAQAFVAGKFNDFIFVLSKLAASGYKETNHLTP